MYSVFDIVGPVMVGPSSSHTVGALRLARAAAKITGPFETVRIILFGSFAETGAGHGTDRAILAGLMGLDIDDERIKDSLELAKKKRWTYGFERAESDAGKHPNTVRFVFGTKNGEFAVEGESIGGGEIRITDVNGIPVSASFKNPTLVTKQKDEPGSMAKVLDAIALEKVNISTVTCWPESRHVSAIALVELERPLDEKTVRAIERLDTVQWARYIDDRWVAIA